MTSQVILPSHMNHGLPHSTDLLPVPAVEGLFITPNFLTPEEQQDCIRQVDANPELWLNDLSRRVQHHGWRYDYKARAITPDMYLGHFPPYLQALARRVHDETGLFDRVPEQVIINEYLPGQGIRSHIDHRGFGPAICTISLLDDWEMDFSPNWRDKSQALLTKGSCLVLTGPARSTWQHGIEPRRSEPGPSGQRPRARRVSLTFRTVLDKDPVYQGG